MCADEQHHGHPGDPVKHPGPHRSTPPVSQPREKPNSAIESHSLPPQPLTGTFFRNNYYCIRVGLQKSDNYHGLLVSDILIVECFFILQYRWLWD